MIVSNDMPAHMAGNVGTDRGPKSFDNETAVAVQKTLESSCVHPARHEGCRCTGKKWIGEMNTQNLEWHKPARRTKDVLY